MNRYLILLFSLLVVCLNGKAQISIGLKDSRYAFLNYTLKDHYGFRIDQSLYSSKISTQYLRGTVGYHSDFDSLKLEGDAYFGSAYGGAYQNYGASASVVYHPIKWMSLIGTANPHYDTFYGFDFCYKAGIIGHVHKDIDLLAYYTTIPDFRQSEKRVRAGFNFHILNLQVEPTISLPLVKPIESVRVQVCCCYTFEQKN